MAKSSEEVEREVEATRGQIDRTVEALKEKMQPKELFDEATRVMGGASNKVLTTVVEQAKENPIPIALIGVGVAWLALSQTRKRRGYDPYSGTGYYETYEGYDEDGGVARKLKARVSGAVETAKGRLAETKEKLTSAVGQAKEGAADGTTTAKGRAAALSEAAKARTAEARRRAEQRFQETLDTEPLILAALGLAVGAAIGASLPASRIENRYVGPVRDKVVGRGREMARSSLDEARTVAQRAYGQVKDELHRQTGPEGEGTTLRDKAQALADAGASTIREEIEGRAPH